MRLGLLGQPEWAVEGERGCSRMEGGGGRPGWAGMAHLAVGRARPSGPERRKEGEGVRFSFFFLFFELFFKSNFQKQF